MSAYNRVILVGRLCADSELKYSQAGKAIATCRLAVNRQGKKDHPECDYIPVVLWEKRAEAFAQYSKKGDERLIEGRIQTRTYEKSDGSKGYAWEVVATDWQFVGAKREQSAPSDAPPDDTPSMADLGMDQEVPF